jgi:cytochrome c oxidase subunit 2
MGSRLPLFPEQASTIAGQVDDLYFFLLAVSIFFSVLIATLVIVFAIKYRRRSENEPPPKPQTGGTTLEVAWCVIPFLISMVIFWWGASIYFKIKSPPEDALEIDVVGKQWMWKLQHMEGQREIDELHIPLGRAVRLKMTSEDVIHSFSVPAFRTKQDVVPGRYTTTWFQATKTGKYHLFCSQYCGTKHSAMIGWVYVMEPTEYEAWLSGGSGEGTLAERGDKLFKDLACANCHHPDGSGRGPSLEGIFGKTVDLEDGTKVTVNEDYLRESILSPQAKVVKGYKPVMPTFQGLVTEDQVLQLIEYIKSTGKKNQPPQTGTPPKAAVKKTATK